MFTQSVRSSRYTGRKTGKLSSHVRFTEWPWDVVKSVDMLLLWNLKELGVEESRAGIGGDHWRLSELSALSSAWQQADKAGTKPLTQRRIIRLWIPISIADSWFLIELETRFMAINENVGYCNGFLVSYVKVFLNWGVLRAHFVPQWDVARVCVKVLLSTR